ncbi:MAG: hypothetical protein ACI9TZ_003368, partial [Yoonia sp.]
AARLLRPPIFNVSGLQSLATVYAWCDISTLRNIGHFNFVATKY